MSKTTNHHLIPRSRGGGNEDENLKGVPDHIHRAWHHLFGNAYGEEVKQLLQLLRLVFGEDATADDMLDQVEKEWMK